MNDTPPRQIAVIRHGEKPGPFGAVGIKEDGREDHHSLTVRGWQRAGALAHFFAEAPRGGLQRPTHIHAPPPDGKDGDHGRPHQTVVPLAARLGLELDTRYGLDEEGELVASILGGSGVVLVSWEHKRIERIAEHIVPVGTAMPAWPDERFDLVWVFDRGPDGAYGFRIVPQLLLGGDADAS